MGVSRWVEVGPGVVFIPAVVPLGESSSALSRKFCTSATKCRKCRKGVVYARLGQHKVEPMKKYLRCHHSRASKFSTGGQATRNKKYTGAPQRYAYKVECGKKGACRMESRAAHTIFWGCASPVLAWIRLPSGRLPGKKQRRYMQ